MATSKEKPSETSEQTIINDIVHGIIKLPDYIKDIIDTAQFQRLRQISQLGFSSFVYPSCDYSRFEHCIGTFHLASNLINQIKLQLEKDGNGQLLEENEIKCVEIAALCHDLGHGPYSHFWTHALDSKIPTREHEILSAEIFEDLINSTTSTRNISIKDKFHFTNDDIELIKGMISGIFNQVKYENKRFLFEIVANKESGLDVDKFDYICRDSIYFGWSNKNKIHDIKRIMHFFRVVKDKNSDKWHLAMRDREIFHIHDVFYYRHLLHRYGYQHKTVKVIECMFRKALKEIVDNPISRDEFIENVLLERREYNDNIWFSKEFISKVCGYHVLDIMKKYTSDIVTKIQDRDLFKLYCKIQVFRKDGSNINIKDDIKKLKELIENLKKISEDTIISAFALQSENTGDPLLSVRFYKKTDNNNSFKFDENSLPDLVKLKCDELIITIFNHKDNENSKYLEIIKDFLCSRKEFDQIQLDNKKIESTMNVLRGITKRLHEIFEFKENLY